MMSNKWGSALAATKLHPPTLPGGLVVRSRLDDMLDAGVGGQVRLVLASAPAGSGKSTLLASWLAGRAEASIWLQVESGDSDPARFWTYLVEAIGQGQPGIASVLRPIVVGSNGEQLVVVPALVNQLSGLDEPLIVVIDDYHLIDNAAVHEGMERLVDLCPEQVTLVLSTRIDPPFRLGRLRVRNHIIEIRGHDLQFDPVEATGLLGSAAESLDTGLLDRLWGRTEGWAAGLVLAGISLSRSANPVQFVEAFHGDDQLVVDYLSDEFLHGVSAEHRRRLLETSVLEQFNGSLVDAVTETSGGAAWLSDTATVNQLLIGLDSTGDWFRYHHLFRDLLRLEAERAFPERLPEFHERAAVWLEAQGDLGKAIAHQLAAGNPGEAARLMFVHGPRLFSDGQVETLRHILEQLGDVAKTVAWCALLWGWVEFIDGRYSRAEEWLDITLDTASESFDEAITAPLRMNIALGRGDVGSALDIARHLTATNQLEAHVSNMATVTGAAYMWAGQTDQARPALELAIDKAVDERALTAQILARVYLAVAEFEDGRTASAHTAAVEALDKAQELGLASYYRLGPAYAIRARTAIDPIGAHDDAELAVELARRTAGDLGLGYVLTICADTLIDLDDPAGKPLLDEARPIIDRCPDPGIAGRYLARIESRHSIAEPSGPRPVELVEPLTEREIAVLRYLPTRMTQREISAELFVTLNTVKTHCSAIYRKLGVGDRKSAVQAARDMDLL